MKNFFAPIAALFYVIPFSLLPQASFAEEAHIVIRKSPPSEAAENRETHTVRKGETLGGILTTRGFRPGQIAAGVEEILRLNPTLEDPRFIYPGQKITMPPTAATAESRGDGVATRGDRSYGTLPVNPDISALAATRRLRPLLEGTLRQLGESLKTDGSLHLPLGDLGTIDIAGAAYPFVQFSTGRSVILDADGTLPREWSSGIPASWPSYAVVSPGGDDDFSDLLGELFRLSGYHSVTSREPFTIGREASVTLVPDFLVLKTSSSLVEDEVFLVNVEGPSLASLPDEIKVLASDHRIRIIEVDPSAEDYAPPAGAEYARNYAFKLTSPNRQLLFQELANRLGLDTGKSLPLTAGTKDRGLSFTPRDSLLLRHGDRQCLVYFGPDLDSLSQLAASGVQTIAAGPGEPLLDVLRSALSALKMKVSGPVVEFYRPSDRHHVTVPGLYLSSPEGPTLITDTDVGDHLSSYLVGSGMNVIQLYLVD